MSTLRTVTEFKAKKPHTCILCRQTIARGERYSYLKFGTKHHIHEARLHTLCAKALSEGADPHGNLPDNPEDDRLIRFVRQMLTEPDEAGRIPVRTVETAMSQHTCRLCGGPIRKDSTFIKVKRKVRNAEGRTVTSADCCHTHCEMLAGMAGIKTSGRETPDSALFRRRIADYVRSSGRLPTDSVRFTSGELAALASRLLEEGIPMPPPGTEKE